PDQRLVRIFDVTADALRALAAERPMALLIDDVQWADEDSLRMLRYLVRSQAAARIFLMLAIRPEETASVNEAVTLMADMDRLGMLHRLKVGRFSRVESIELLQQVLGGQVDASTAAVMHAQAEGVPFILAEQALAYRDASLVQQIDGVWTLARNAQRMLPSAVRTLIQRRAARLPEATRTALAHAAVLGRSVSLIDLGEIEARLMGEAPAAEDLAASFAPAVAAGLLIQHPDGSPADYTFTHEQVREYAASTLPPPRRRAIHAAIVGMLTRGGDPLPESLPLLAQHALAAGDGELTARASVQAAEAALKANAPEEALRLVELAQPVASRAQDRVALLLLRDSALGTLRRPAQRLEALTELAALAEAMGDTHLEFDVMLRRAAAFRLSEDHDVAASIARRVRDEAAAAGNAPIELAACIELGQDLMRADLGEGMTVTPTEADFDGAWEAFSRAVEIAEAVQDESMVAAATRELGVISMSRVRVGFVKAVEAGQHLEILGRLTAGATIEDILPELPIAPFHADASARFQRALEIYERLGDRQGTMATIIAMATLSWAPNIHLLGSPGQIEEIRRLATRMKTMTRQSERALADAQMLFGAHVYARDRLFADAALAKGAEAFGAARVLGERGLEFAAAGGVALQHAQLGSVEEAGRWLERAAAVASAAPTPLRARQMEAWRGVVCAAAGDAAGAEAHLGRAVALATEHGQPAARCEMLALRALSLAWLVAESDDDRLSTLAEGAAVEALRLTGTLPGHPPWGAQAQAALALVRSGRGDEVGALEAGRAALRLLHDAVREDIPLETILAAARPVLKDGSGEEQGPLLQQLRLTLVLATQRITDEEVRARWFRSRTGRELVRLAGPLDEMSHGVAASRPDAALEPEERSLLRRVTEGRTNAEIARELEIGEDVVIRRLALLFAKIGAASRAQAMTVAITGQLV
ncbi:MAG: hypothetical protein EPO16_06500, partial [Dehalococcoidia bacterium]